MMFSSKSLVTIALVLGCVCAPAVAASTFAKDLGDATGPLVVAGIAATYFNGGDGAAAKAAKVTDAAAVSVGISELLKPNLSVGGEGTHIHSFPSGHTAIAFGTATSLSEVFPKQKWALYAGAALIGWGRVEADEHTWKDVLGGAALGVGVGKWAMASPDGLLIGKVYKF